MDGRSSISIINKNGSMDTIYGRWDGEVNEIGVMLVLYYSDKEKLKELISLGDIVYLGREIHPVGEHSDSSPEAGVTLFEGRDAGNTDTKASCFTNILDFLSKGYLDTHTYNYIFKEKNQRWYFTDTLHVRIRDSSQESSPLTPNDVVLQPLIPLVKYHINVIRSPLKEEFLQFEKERKVAKDYKKLTKDLNNSSSPEIKDKKTKMKI